MSISSFATSFDSFHHNNIYSSRLAGGQTDYFNNNLISGASFDNCNLNIYDCEAPRISFDGCDGTITNSCFGYTDIVDNSNLTFSDNVFIYDGAASGNFGYLARIIDSDVSFAYNLMFSIEEITRAVTSTCEFYNNTLIFSDRGFNLSRSNADIENNILVGDGIDCPLFWLWHDEDNVDAVRYNVIYNVSELITGFGGEGDELDSTNIVINPLFNGGDPFDYHLRPDSPCIDAGNPDNPDDPDETRADIGAFFYDQSIDNPPAFISAPNLIEQNGMVMNYSAVAIDDNGPINFRFRGLPEGLEVQEFELDWLMDSLLVTGEPETPDTVERNWEFDFTVYVEDGIGQIDSQNVHVLMQPYTVIGGEMTGVISADDSPYLVANDVIVPEGDSLLIEGGSAVYFQPVEIVDQRRKFQIYGKLIVAGTENDSVIFSILPGDVLEGWRGLFFYESDDTSMISNAYIYGAYRGIGAESGAKIKINKSTFNDNDRAIDINNNSYTFIDSSIFTINEIVNFAGFIGINESFAIINNSYFNNCNTLP
ncbi:MAG: hypothetical protein RAP03_09665, partial [Candidatus Electryonea clarkiae]|nr:hypothetical protein [Candidatus Electryonea clarkiae]